MPETEPAVANRKILFGAAYYAEYQPERSIDVDFDLMAEAGFSVIRVGESVWSRWEPRDGEFRLDWLEPVLDAAHARGISVILGTATYAIPMWLARKHPEINAEKSTGAPMGWGRRQEIDYTNLEFRRHADRIIRAVIARYAEHPAVIGFQVDNEPGVALLHNDGVFRRFVGWLEHRYGTVDRLNEEWGLVYWSHELTDWSELWRPDGNAQPQYDLAWRRFQVEMLDEFISWQAAIVREYSRPDQFVTTCYSYFVRPAMHDESCSRSLDVVSGNAYFRVQDALALPSSPVTGVSAAQMDGAWRIAFAGDRMYSGKQAPFLVTETNAGSIGPQSFTEPAWDGQWRQIAWMLVARGAQMIEYWHWQTLQYGAETYWHGVLPHSRKPDRVFRQLAELGKEFAAAGDLVAGLRPQSDIAFLFSNDSKLAVEFSSFLPGRGGGPDPDATLVVLHTLYRAAFEAGLSARIVHTEQLIGSTGGSVAPSLGVDSARRPAVPYMDPVIAASEFPVLVAIGLTVLGDEVLTWLRAYAQAGGHLVIGPRTGYHDHEARARTNTHPAMLADLAQVEYVEYATLREPTTVLLDARFGSSSDAAATGWIDYLATTGAEVLGAYDRRGFEGVPALTTAEAGQGRVTTLGTIPDAGLASTLMAWLIPTEDPWVAMRRTHGSTVTVSNSTTRGGGVLRVVHNWSWSPATITLPQDVRDVASGQSFSAGTTVTLEAWDVRPWLVSAVASDQVH